LRLGPALLFLAEREHTPSGELTEQVRLGAVAQRIPGRPAIEIADRQLRDVTEDALHAIEFVNDPPRVFCQAGVPVRLHVEPDTNQVILQPLTGKALRNNGA
jgi:hypothetical protein